MQLLNPPLERLSDLSQDRLLEALNDIASNIEIGADFRIAHPNYKPLEIPEDTIQRFQSVPLELQHKYLSLQLQRFLYGIYYNASMRVAFRKDVDKDDNTVNLSLHQDLENNTFLGMDLKFYHQLHESNCGKGYDDPGWQVLRQEKDGSLAVEKGGLTLHINDDRYLSEISAPFNPSTSVGDRLSLRMPRNLVQNGFYMSVGNAGLSSRTGDRSGNLQDTARIYFHLSPEGAVAVMASLTQRLNAINLPFSFKVLYNPSNYDRYDSGVLYFEKSFYPQVREALQALYAETQIYFRPEIPLFTKQLAPGLAVAEEPDLKFTEQESFGTNRCQIVANGLLKAWLAGKNLPEDRLEAIFASFFTLGIAIERPYLNANSEDIYNW
ncbi:T3SS effector HopA1 family protein [Pseudanabaena sp. PCC 6802]|uniref:T3SS effector HopA1 family protein n=1 Tax=Pseudanabaena sp. PCC 6802 TaxID=118173 RepID=UPI0003451CD9|nr:T3SS effector HopA1 family protein [Pseudanabaena sp. PCC 6802]